ncbi:MAG: hypothetical protein KOO61_04040 [Spirochaetales bacterium]|nr:hypothetical protein [Spirochaetales bacterium]
MELDPVCEKIERESAASDRLLSQIDFARELALHMDRDDWLALVDQAENASRTRRDQAQSIQTIVDHVEEILKPIGPEAKNYCLNYVAHAHIDMDWLWSWPETVKSCYRTFATMVDLMDEFPDYRFSQSQILTYEIARSFSPELFERIKEKIAGGQWEVTANSWVEADKNMSSGESQVRQILCAKKYMREHLGIDPETVQVDWATDTFGHPLATPSILRQAGIRYYYLRRPGSDMQPDICEGKPGKMPWLFWWVGEDDSRLLVWNNDRFPFVDKHVASSDVAYVLRHETATGLRQFMIVYGVGNHGGGPSRDDIRKIEEMGKWPIFPATRCSTVQEYFKLVEEEAGDLPEVRGELNFVHRGCYSSQSRIKHSNRRAENQLFISESIASIAGTFANFVYPKDELEQSWKMAMFNQFHDILPGAGIRESNEHAQGQHLEIEARTSTVIDRAVRQMAVNVNTGGERGIPVVVFNPTSQPRTDKVELVLYDVSGTHDLVVRDGQGGAVAAHIMETQASLWEKNAKGDSFYGRKGFYNTFYDDIPQPPMLRFDMEYGHQFAQIVFTAKEVPPLGYKTFWIDEVARLPEECRTSGALAGHTTTGAWMENAFLRVEIDAKSSSVVSLFDKRTSRELVPGKKNFGQLHFEREEPHRMSAWIKGRLTEAWALASGGTLEVVESGPSRAMVRCHNTFLDSSFDLDIILHRDLPELDFTLNVVWHEKGGRDTGVPTLKVYFPVSLDNPRHVYDAPFGSIRRDADGKEVPAQRWGAVVEEDGAGITIVNSHTYSYSGDDDGIAMCLLRSSYEPDPLPEMGRHRITYSVYPSTQWSPEHASSVATSFNCPLIPMRTEPREGPWPAERTFLSIEPTNVQLSAFKEAEDGGGTILRLFECSGEGCTALVTAARAISEVYEIDPMERDSSQKSVDIQDGTRFQVTIDPHQVKTLLIHFADVVGSSVGGAPTRQPES